MSTSKSRHIPALDGLRAFAVLAVIAYHFGFGWVSGGLLGVTVFFVLSGYLITSLLVIEWRRTHTIDLKAFWMRRIRRLLPAIIFVLLCTVALCALFNHDLLTKMRPDIPPALFFYSNWWYIFRDVSYFETMGAPSPLTHFWSLAIEEQFYVIWPLIMFALFKFGKKKKVATSVTLGLAILSVIMMMVIYDPAADPSRVYYGTDTRAFSLLIGALLAFIWPSTQLAGAQTTPLPSSTRMILDGAGILSFIGLVIMVGFVDGFSPFMYRGGILLASLLTAVVIAVLVHPQSGIAKVFALPPFVWIGKRSYGMYLWHYPLILIMTPQNFAGSYEWWRVLLILLAIFACSAFSFRFIEDPLRKGAIGRFLSSVKAGEIQPLQYAQTHLIPVVAGCALVLFSSVAFAVVPDSNPLEEMEAMEQMARDEAAALLAEQEAIAAAAEAEKQKYDVLLIGDSVCIRTIPYFKETFPNGMIDSAVSRPFSDGTIVYDFYKDLDLVGDTVVISLGTNGPAADEQIDELMEVINASGPKTVYFINTRCPDPWMQTTNNTLARAPERHDNVRLIDWFAVSDGHPEYFDGDGTHLTEEAAVVFTEMICSALNYTTPTIEGGEAPEADNTNDQATAA